MGRAAVHPSALYPQSKHDKWEPSLAGLKMKTRIHLYPKTLTEEGRDGEGGDGEKHAHGGLFTCGLAFYAHTEGVWGGGGIKARNI